MQIWKVILLVENQQQVFVLRYTIALYCGVQENSRVALSSTEAEYVALSHCASEAHWLQNLLSELKLDDVAKTVVIFEDNQSAIRSANGNGQPKRLKHIDIKYHFVRKMLKEGRIYVKYVCSPDQVADILTKPLSKCQFVKFVRVRIAIERVDSMFRVIFFCKNIL